MKALLTIVLILLISLARSQSVAIQQLTDEVVKGSGRFVNAKPLIVKLDRNRIFLYNEWLYEQKKIRLPDSIYLQFINNSQKADTIHWTDNELPSSIIVKGKYLPVDLDYVLTKFASLDSNKKERLLWQIDHYAKAKPHDRLVFFFSRPVFDNSKSYAIVQYDNGHSWMMGGGGIKLYHLYKGTWSEMALLVRWSY